MNRNLVAIVMLVGASVCASGQAADNWIVEAGPIIDLGKTPVWTKMPNGAVVSKQNPPANGPEMLTGTFFAGIDPSGTSSDGLGGACLIVDVKGTDVSSPACEVDDDCPKYLERNGTAQTDTNGWGYCLSSAPGKPKQCWLRPGPQADYCAGTVISRMPLREGTHYLPLVKSHPNGINGNVRWRVHVCLNPAGATPCKDGPESARVTSDGVPKKF